MRSLRCRFAASPSLRVSGRAFVATTAATRHADTPNQEYAFPPVLPTETEVPGNTSAPHLRGLEQTWPSTDTMSCSKLQKTTHNTRLADPDYWMNKLELYLPTSLRLRDRQKAITNASADYVVAILRGARNGIGTDFDLLLYMIVEYDRDEAVLHLLERLLKESSKTTDAQLPSNIVWPNSLFDKYDATLGALDIQRPLESESRYEQIGERFATCETQESQRSRASVEQFWLSLGHMVLAASRAEGSQKKHIMTVVYHALARAHSLDLVPKEIYSWAPTPFSSTLKRPPMLHLLSSRILTTLSDAVWRSKQAELITQAVQEKSLEAVFRDPPGGRFRLKVRELGPEVWLEFILWCCVGGNFYRAGESLVRSLGRDLENPWFAISWDSTESSQPAALVNWDRVSARTGGTVGQIEGYSADEPLASVPARTISVEVVLALIEAQLNASRMSTTAGGKPGMPRPMARFMARINALVTFLEPHALPTSYFDYLAVRLLQSDLLHVDQRAEFLQTWLQHIQDFRQLETAKPSTEADATLKYQDIVSRNGLVQALMHQVLTLSLKEDRITKAIDQFSSLQYEIDKAKVQSMISFMGEVQPNERGTLQETSDPSTRIARAEYIDSYGQLPLHITATFVEKLVEADQTDLALWMVYSDDIDGPVLSPSTFSELSVARALIQLASKSHDTWLIKQIQQAMAKLRLKLPVTFLRIQVDSAIKTHDFGRAVALLTQLREAVAGGYSPGNLAVLLATILRLQGIIQRNRIALDAQHHLARAIALFEEIMQGRYDGTRGDFYDSQTKLFRQQVGHLLSIIDVLLPSRITDSVRRFRARYSSGATASLQPAAFNTILSAVVDVYGARWGRALWDIFCIRPLEVDHDPSSEDGRLKLYLKNMDSKLSNMGQPSAQQAEAERAKQEPKSLGEAVNPNDDPHMGEDSQNLADQNEFLTRDPHLSNSVKFRSDAASTATSHSSILRTSPAQNSTHDTLTDVEHGSTDQLFPQLSQAKNRRQHAVVSPNVSTMRIILRSALQLPDRKQRDDLVQWATDFYGQLQWSESDIEREKQLLSEKIDGAGSQDLAEDTSSSAVGWQDSLT
jgi:hypothetical protein